MTDLSGLKFFFVASTKYIGFFVCSFCQRLKVVKSRYLKGFSGCC